MAYKYFHYSAQQLAFRRKVEQNMGRTFKPGVVFSKGRRYSFTEVSTSMQSTYSDDKIVAEGEEGSLIYTMPSSR